MGVIVDYCLALALTLAVEVPLIALMSPREHRAAYLRAVLLLNLFTHPLANLAFWAGTGSFFEIEAAVLLLEALGYMWVLGLRLPRALFLSVVVNVATGAASLLFH